MRKLLYRRILQDMVLLYTAQQDVVSLIIVPLNKEKYVDFNSDLPEDGMIQLSLCGDKHFRHYCGGQTLRNGESATGVRLVGQNCEKRETEETITTSFILKENIKVSNIIRHPDGARYFTCENIIFNGSAQNITVEMFASCCISGISPYVGKEASLKLHRLFGNWSAEGREDSRKFESAGLEESWADYGVRLEKFGSVGSMPVQKYFPFVCVEDTDHFTSWGAAFDAPCSWQAEVFRYNKNVSISGGVADYEYGHNRMTVPAGKHYSSGVSYLTVCNGGAEEVWNRLNTAFNRQENEEEKFLPIIYNEYCTSWGNPSAEEVERLLPEVKKYGAKYFVIDAGWYCGREEDWALKVGDYKPDKIAFPESIKKTAEKIRDYGMIPGIWFEPEIAAEKSEVYSNNEMFLTRDGYRIVMKDRSFFDFRQETVRAYLRKRVIDFVKENGFGYVKLDYNECLGIGCDGAESYGAGLRQHIEGVLAFVKELKESVPGLILEICSAGGHRIEPAFLALADMVSFSDAHEVAEGAVVAANVNRICPSVKNQIWAVINQEYSDAQTRYSLAKTFFGRMCLSGDLTLLRASQKKIIRSAVALYKKVRYILADSTLHIYGDRDLKYRDLIGMQAGLKVSADGTGALLIVHSFRDCGEISVTDEKLKNYKIEDIFADEKCEVQKEGKNIRIRMEEFDGCVIHLRRVNNEQTDPDAA